MEQAAENNLFLSPLPCLFCKAEQLSASKAINKYKPNRAGSQGMFLIWVKMGGWFLFFKKGDFPSLNVKQLQVLMDLLFLLQASVRQREGEGGEG